MDIRRSHVWAAVTSVDWGAPPRVISCRVADDGSSGSGAPGRWGGGRRAPRPPGTMGPLGQGNPLHQTIHSPRIVRTAREGRKKGGGALASESAVARRQHGLSGQGPVDDRIARRRGRRVATSRPSHGGPGWEEGARWLGRPGGGGADPGGPMGDAQPTPVGWPCASPGRRRYPEGRAGRQQGCIEAAGSPGIQETGNPNPGNRESEPRKPEKKPGRQAANQASAPRRRSNSMARANACSRFTFEMRFVIMPWTTCRICSGSRGLVKKFSMPASLMA